MLKNILTPKISKSPQFTQRNTTDNQVSQSRDKKITTFTATNTMNISIKNKLNNTTSSNHIKMPKNFSFIEVAKTNNLVTNGGATKRGPDFNHTQNPFAVKTDRSNTDILLNTNKIVSQIVNKFQCGTTKNMNPTSNMQNTTNVNIANFARKFFQPSKLI